MLSWINVSAGVLSDYIHSAVLQGPASLNRERGEEKKTKTCLLIFGGKNPHRGICWCEFGIILCVMHDKKLKNNVQQSRGMLTEA